MLLASPHSSNPSRYGTSFYRWIMWLHNAMSYGLWERCEANQSVEQTRWLLIESRKLKKASLHVWRQHQSDQRSNRTWFDILQKSINRQIEEFYCLQIEWVKSATGRLFIVWIWVDVSSSHQTTLFMLYHSRHENKRHIFYSYFCVIVYLCWSVIKRKNKRAAKMQWII